MPVIINLLYFCLILFDETFLNQENVDTRKYSSGNHRRRFGSNDKEFISGIIPLFFIKFSYFLFSWFKRSIVVGRGGSKILRWWMHLDVYIDDKSGQVIGIGYYLRLQGRQAKVWKPLDEVRREQKGETLINFFSLTKYFYTPNM